jgi:hypothetical protein
MIWQLHTNLFNQKIKAAVISGLTEKLQNVYFSLLINYQTIDHISTVVRDDT